MQQTLGAPAWEVMEGYLDNYVDYGDELINCLITYHMEDAIDGSDEFTRVLSVPVIDSIEVMGDMTKAEIKHAEAYFSRYLADNADVLMIWD